MKVAVLRVALLFSILLCSLAEAKMDLDNVEILKIVGTMSSAGVTPSPCIVTTLQTIPVCPSIAECTPTDTPDNTPDPWSFASEPLDKDPCCIPIPVTPGPHLDDPGCSPCSSCASWPGPQCF
ncbi:hypothetical protein HGM15179_019003 [Zosterops borbonicus]|uniref:Uncharacterized protein n=1 Tax=Zosterops borbonicus TaxID=364589 RepID=A0A8K1DA54_9PASS|nr:hypothetical protein HGM15179_019003 [Zosterops borbonicus]